MATIRFPGGRGPAGAAGATGPAGPAGAGSITAPQAAWVNEAGVEGVDVAFDAGDWQDAATAVPAAGCVVATVDTLGDALLLTAGSTGSSAINRSVVLASGDDLCARVVVNFGQSILSGLTAQFQVATFNAAGAATNWSGAGMSASNSSLFTCPHGSFHTTSTNINSTSSGSTTNAGGFVAGMVDFRIRRSGADLLKYMSIGGAWQLLGAAASSGFTADAGNMAGFRMQTGAGQSMTVQVLAWKHFVGGLPAGLQ
jgi:hypothetical protein